MKMNCASILFVAVATASSNAAAYVRYTTAAPGRCVPYTNEYTYLIEIDTIENFDPDVNLPLRCGLDRHYTPWRTPYSISAFVEDRNNAEAVSCVFHWQDFNSDGTMEAAGNFYFNSGTTFWAGWKDIGVTINDPEYAVNYTRTVWVLECSVPDIGPPVNQECGVTSIKVEELDLTGH